MRAAISRAARNRVIRRAAWFALACVLLPIRTSGQDHPYFPNVLLVDQSGRAAPFYDGWLRGRTLVIQCFFSSCHGACPVTLAKMRAVQDALGDLAGRDITLLSLTVDPEHDTPARLSEVARALGAGPGWHLLSGDPQNVKTVLSRLGQYTPSPDTHNTVFLIGNEPVGLWGKLPGTAAPGDIASAARRLATQPSERDR